MLKKNKVWLIIFAVILISIKITFKTTASKSSTDDLGPVKIEKQMDSKKVTKIKKSRNKTAAAEIPIFRIFNPNSGQQLHTTNVHERDNLVELGWQSRETSLYCTDSGQQLFRLYNPNSGEHLYTLNTIERELLTEYGWRDEGVAWVTPRNGLPVYRLFNKDSKDRTTHHYTTQISERETLLASGWRDEGISWYTTTIQTPIPTYLNFLGINRDLVIDELSKHENDRYYLGTPYKKLGHGEVMLPGIGMNCTGFVAKVIENAGGDLIQITKISYHWGGIANAYNWRNTLGKKLTSYSFNNISELLESNQARKGDIIYFEPDYSELNHDCHIGFFWGEDSNDNRMWHSTPSENKIGEIYSPAGYSKVIIYRI
ncbi:hypothetical protein IGI39_003895 [Enterococcus sp. AZ135]|uniref:hypothetical protein n=1 Tax=unclassified Enterococcus TaxID=2608891 RepID=UPI003F1E546A